MRTIVHGRGTSIADLGAAFRTWSHEGVFEVLPGVVAGSLAFVRQYTVGLVHLAETTNTRASRHDAGHQGKPGANSKYVYKCILEVVP